MPFLLALPVKRLGRRRQRPRGLGCGCPRLVKPGENGLPFGGEICASHGDALHLLGSRQRSLTLAAQGLFGLPDSRLHFEHWIRGLSTSVGNGGDDLAGRGDRSEILMSLHDARPFQPIRHQDDAAKEVGHESTDLIGSLDQVNYGKQPLGRWRRQRVCRPIKQGFARILGGGHCRSGAGDAIPTRRDPTMQPPLERRLDGGPMDGLDLDQFEQAFPIAVNP